MRPEQNASPTLPLVDFDQDVETTVLGITPLQPALNAATADAVVHKLDQKWYFEADAGKFWVLTDEGRWAKLGERSFLLHLRMNDFDATQKKGAKASEVEVEVHKTMLYRQVAYAGPLAGWKVGLVQFADTMALITRSPVLPEPVEAGDRFEVIEGFLYSLLVGQEPDGTWIDQRPFFLCWMQHAMQSLYAGIPTRGLCLVLAGEAGSGKTLLKEFIRMCFGGRECLPYDYMLGKDNFNRELSEAPLWVVDDVAAGTKAEDRVKFGAEIKKVVANTSMKIRGIQRDGMILNPFRRLVICVNNEPDRLLVLPPIDDDLADKVMIFKGYKGTMPRPLSTEEQKVRFWNELIGELPGWLHWLLNTWEDTNTAVGRFGVVPFHHPEIIDALSEIAPETRVLDWLAIWFNWKNVSNWTGSTSDLRAELAHADCPIGHHDKGKLPEGPWLGKRLKKLQRKYPQRFFDRKKSTGTEWTIWRENRPKSGGTENE